VYPLVRAYWRTGDEQYAELFWQLVESWRAQNPPQQGPNWKCGQEISLRVMAWCFGLFGFLDSPRTTAERVTRLAHMIAVSGQRIEANLNYALSQRNNHGISEGMGLWTIGVLFPELRLAAKWRRLGRQVLATQGQELIYDDGAFAQHSVNYQRLMLHDYLWALRLGELYGQPFSAALKERIGKAGVFLYHIQDETSGRVPCYGQNDGALILPLNNCDFHDFRPVVQAIHYLTTGTRCYAAGPWDEDLLWLFGPRALTAPVQAQERGNFRADQGGYYVLRSCSSFAFTRCATFRHRPGQADMLHVDLWWRGQNVALDAGTYSYNAPEPWNNSFSHTAYHNTVIVDSRDQMERVGPFLWLPWLRGWLNRCQEAPGRHLAYWEGEHNGYARLKPPVRYRRGIVRLGHESWLILDALSSSGAHQYRLPWLLPDLPYTWDEAAGYLVLHTPVGPYHTRLATLSGSGTYSLMQADAHSPRGWRAPYYGCREPALSIELIDHAPETLFWTLFGPTPWQVTVEEDTLRIDANLWHAVINLQGDTKKPVIASASIIGTFNDRLELT
jgi:asparagine synthase (glutamine-hydrolysing)